jgi:hypothetical protein
MAQGRCFKCNSPRIRRARAHAASSRLIRAVTPLRRYQCELCSHRGWTLAALSSSGEDEPQAPTGRPVESRDVQQRQAAAWRLVLLVAISLLLGMLVARLATPPVEVDQQQVP